MRYRLTLKYITYFEILNKIDSVLVETEFTGCIKTNHWLFTLNFKSVVFSEFARRLTQGLATSVKRSGTGA